MAKLHGHPLFKKHVQRKRDGAIGQVVSVVLSVPSIARPGVYGKTLVTIRYEDESVRAAAGGDSTGDLSWFRSNFKVLR